MSLVTGPWANARQHHERRAVRTALALDGRKLERNEGSPGCGDARNGAPCREGAQVNSGRNDQEPHDGDEGSRTPE